jgi:laminin alpha 3/5
MMIVHYFQPNHAAVNLTVEIDSINKGSLHAAYCPSISGCRGIVLFHSSGEVFENADIRSVKFTNIQNDKEIWLDYFLIAPAASVDPEQLQATVPIKLTDDFISQCASHHFSVEQNKSPFCDQSMLSLSAKYNGGAQECACDSDGTINNNQNECAKFGGQCACKQNVIGRQCNRCKSGFYGFPDCKECNCLSGSCNDITGKCDCPINVDEKTCNTCLDNYYGFHPKSGCEDCDCELASTVNASNYCHKESGQCQCLFNTDGRRCDQCRNGFFSYPRCLECRCNKNGTTDEICDPQTAQCKCKKNVLGDQCTYCTDDTFNLDAKNVDGCTKCFCFGQTTRCISAELYIKKLKYMRPNEEEDWQEWQFRSEQKSIDFTQDVKLINSTEHEGLELEINSDLLAESKLNEPIYWTAPRPYIGNKVTSYGSSIRYKIRIEKPIEGTEFIRPDFIIKNSNMVLIYTSLRRPEDGQTYENEINLIETEFSHFATGSKVSREQLMTVLSSITEIQLKATFYNKLHVSELLEFEMDLAVESSEDGVDLSMQALSAERCGCPPTFRGYSCESCEDGYYKVKSNGPGLFNCAKCNCNNHAYTCDQETGRCLECQGNTEGFNCEKCKKGYHMIDLGNGDFECRLCPCPGSNEANVFADSCMFDSNSNNVYYCQCRPGYTGQFCQRCAPGYYGKF